MDVVVGDIYHHFKGHDYRILAIAKHSESLEKMVVYQLIEDPSVVWVRPYDMFLEKVDKQKYPNVAQSMRFQRIEHD